MRTDEQIETLLLAPVPCLHLPSAMETCAIQGRVAFATQKAELFEADTALTPASGWNVLIYASRPDLGVPQGYRNRVSRVSFSAVFVAWVRADRHGRHPNPSVRPVSTEDDTPVMGFWEIADLQPLDQLVPLTTFRTAANGRRVNREPRGPIIVWRQA